MENLPNHTMKKIPFFLQSLTSSMIMAIAFSTHAADARYPVKAITKINIFEPSGNYAWENKNWLDCNDVVLTEDDVRYALRHIRKVSEKSYFSEETERTGCAGGASVHFKTGNIIVMSIEPTGRISIFQANEKLEPTGSPISFYDCQLCKERKMELLKDALARATERRLEELKRLGKLPP